MEIAGGALIESARALPTGSAATRVAESLLSAGPATAPQLAQRLGVSPQAIRRHLDQLLDHGLIAATDEPPFGPRPQRGRGRPPKVYALTQAGRDAFGQSYDDLAVNALRFLAEHGGPDAVAEFTAQRAQEMVGRHADRINAADDPVAELAKALSEDGYAAALVDDPQRPGLQLCQQNCPVAHVAAVFPQLCEAEAEAIGTALGRHVTRLATIAGGDAVCTLHVPRENPDTSVSSASSKQPDHQQIAASRPRRETA